MNPSTSRGTRSNVAMAKPSPPVRQAGNIARLLLIHGVCRRSVPSVCPQVKSRCRCRARMPTHYLRVSCLVHRTGKARKRYKTQNRITERTAVQTYPDDFTLFRMALSELLHLEKVAL